MGTDFSHGLYAQKFQEKRENKLKVLIEENESADGKINETQEPPDEQMSDIDNSEENGSQINASNLSTADSETQTITDADTILGTQTESLTSLAVKKRILQIC